MNKANTYRYILEPYKGKSSRHKCPDCLGRYELTLYVDRETGQPLADHVGKCNREHKCGYHMTPAMYREELGQANTPPPVYVPEPVENLPIEYIPIEYLSNTVDEKYFPHNNLFKYLS